MEVEITITPRNKRKWRKVTVESQDGERQLVAQFIYTKDARRYADRIVALVKGRVWRFEPVPVKIYID